MALWYLSPFTLAGCDIGGAMAGTVPGRGLVVIGMAVSALVLTGCAQSTSATVEPEPESLPATSSETPEEAVDEDVFVPSTEPAVPDTVMQAVAVATGACLQGFVADEPSINPWNLDGVVMSYAINRGDIEFPGDDLDAATITDFHMWMTDFSAQGFQTAAALDPTYQPFADLWEKASNQAIKAWNRGGVNPTQAATRAQMTLDKLTARCRVPFATAMAAGQASGAADLEEWARSIAGPLLPPEWEKPEFVPDLTTD